jgi:hypothetical protein
VLLHSTTLHASPLSVPPSEEVHIEQRDSNASSPVNKTFLSASGVQRTDPVLLLSNPVDAEDGLLWRWVGAVM